MHPKKLEEKYKLERARLEQKLSYQRRILEVPNKSVQKCYNWLQNKIYSKFEEQPFEQKNVRNDGTIYIKLSEDVPSFHQLHEKNETINIDKKAPKIGQDLFKQLKRVSIPIFIVTRKCTRIEKQPLQPTYIKHLQQKKDLKDYQAAKERLERKYVGTRWKILVYINALDNFKPIREVTQKMLRSLQTC